MRDDGMRMHGGADASPAALDAASPARAATNPSTHATHGGHGAHGGTGALRHVLKRHAHELFGRRPEVADLLLAHGLADPRLLAEAQARAEAHGTHSGDVLVATGWVRQYDYQNALAASRSIPFADLRRHPGPVELLRAEDIDAYMRMQAIPVAGGPDGVRYAAASSDGAVHPPARLRPHGADAPRPVIALTTRRDIKDTLIEAFAGPLTERAISTLRRWAPGLSADRRLTGGQMLFLGLAALAVLAGLVFATGPALIALNLAFSACFLSVIGLRAVSIIFGLEPARMLRTRRPEPIADRDLPVYSILVPLYHEAAMLAYLAEALMSLDYPAEKLDIKLIFEADDGETIAAAKRLGLPGNFDFIIVPPSRPRTKPKALNFALAFVRGDYVVIYDAEDRPEPRQLRDALEAFRDGPPGLACLQARLSFYNADENWLTRQFTLEYAALFDLMLPALQRLGLPIPLGGTSNHFRLSVLRQILGWDPFNVTEDADLGIRLARLGHEAGMLDSTTYEEASCTFKTWLGQRSRWLKGWIQTYFVHMREPFALLDDLGFAGFFAVQVVMGAVVMAALIHPFFFLAVPMAIASGFLWETLAAPAGAALLSMNAVVLLGGYGVSIAAAWLAARKRALFRLEKHALFTPVYWLMISLGAYVGLWHFIVRPFHWVKTAHGQSRVFKRPAAARVTPP